MFGPHGFPNYLHALRYGLDRGVNHKMLTVPCMVLAGSDVFPSGRVQSGNVNDSLPHPTPMFIAVEALHLDFYEGNSCGVRYCDPSVTSQVNRIDRIRDHRSTDSKVVFSDRVGNPIPDIIDGLAQQSRISDGLLDRVNTQMHGSDLTGQFPGDGCLPSSG